MTVKHKRMVVLAGVLAIVVVLFHAPVLRGLAGFLIADEPAGPFEYVGLFNWNYEPDGERSYAMAVQLYREGAVRGIVLIDNCPDRLIETGALPSFGTLVRNKLRNDGVASKSITLLDNDGADDWARARTIRAWLANRPNATLLVLCERFRSARVRQAIDAVLDPTAAARVGVRGTPSFLFDETNWWTSRVGIKGVGFAGLRRIHAWCADGDRLPLPSVSADEYERNVHAEWNQ